MLLRLQQKTRQKLGKLNNEKLENDNAAGARGAVADYQLSEPCADSAPDAFLESTGLPGDPASRYVINRICRRIFYTQETGLR